jgi:hypothetical protein
MNSENVTADMIMKLDRDEFPILNIIDPKDYKSVAETVNELSIFGGLSAA